MLALAIPPVIPYIDLTMVARIRADHVITGAQECEKRAVVRRDTAGSHQVVFAAFNVEQLLLELVLIGVAVPRVANPWSP